MTTDLYATLALKKTASAAQIRSAYRKLAKRHHPDAGGEEVAFQALNLAHRVLSDPKLRARYDETGSVDLNSLENERAAFLEIIAQHAAAALQHPEQNFLLTAKTSLRAKIQEGEQATTQNNAALKNLEKVLQNLKRKAGDGALLTVLNAQRQQIQQVLSNNESLVSRFKAALQHLEDYEFEHTNQLIYPPQQGNWTIWR